MLYPRTIIMAVNIIIAHRLHYRVRVRTSTSVFVPGTKAVPYLLLYSNSMKQDTGQLEKISIIRLAGGKIRHQKVSSLVQ